MKVSEKQKISFWEKVLKLEHGCWEWQGAKTPFGYGKIHLRNCGENEYHNAHRLSWFLHFGEIPSNLMVLHKCDNPKCCNPSHLFLGTALDNSQDMAQKGRYSKILLNPEKQKEISALAKSDTARKKKANTMKQNKHQQGEKNSGYGTYWLTNGISSIKWDDSLGEFPVGFSKGRVMRHNK